MYYDDNFVFTFTDVVLATSHAPWVDDGTRWQLGLLTGQTLWAPRSRLVGFSYCRMRLSDVESAT